MKIGFLGAGTWGFTIATLLASNGHEVTMWDRNTSLIDTLRNTQTHPRLGKSTVSETLLYADTPQEAIKHAQLIVESVTSKGIRPVFEELLGSGLQKVPIIMTSKGIERESGLLMPELLLGVLGEAFRPFIGCLTGPSHAEEVFHQVPTTVVGSAWNTDIMHLICQTFMRPSFRVYPNSDIIGTAFGGAMKNPMAIATAVCDEIGFGDNTKAALMTRGLHEMRKLSQMKECNPDTLNGLSGLGDLCVTCLSTHSRNYRFGRLIASGRSIDEALEEIGMVVEGINTCQAAMNLSEKSGIAIPITAGVHSIIFEQQDPRKVVQALMQREVKDEFE